VFAIRQGRYYVDSAGEVLSGDKKIVSEGIVLGMSARSLVRPGCVHPRRLRPRSGQGRRQGRRTVNIF
jgi:hypothetical protein